VIVTLTIIVIFLSIFNVITMLTLTGKATAQTQGSSSLCIAKPPLIVPIANQVMGFNNTLNYQVNATFYGDNTNNSFTDNTSLFNINFSGYINFTSNFSLVGVYNILITVGDSSICGSRVSSTTLFLNITSNGSELPPEELPSENVTVDVGDGTSSLSPGNCARGYVPSGSGCVKIVPPAEPLPPEVPPEEVEVPQPEPPIPWGEVEAGRGPLVGLAGYSTRVKIFIFAFPLMFLLLLIIFLFMIYLRRREKERDRKRILLAKYKVMVQK